MAPLQQTPAQAQQPPRPSKKPTPNLSKSKTSDRPSPSLSPAYTLDTHGFTVLKHASALCSPPYTRESWNDHNLRKANHYPEIEDLMLKVTGAKKIMILGGIARTRLHREPVPPKPEDVQKRIATGNNTYPAFVADRPRVKGFEENESQGPAKKPHIDFGPVGARSTLRNWRQDIADEAADIIAAEEEAERLPGGIKENYKGRRWGMYGTWMPLSQVKRDPLAFAEWRSVKDEDLVRYVLRPPGINGPYETDIKLAKAGAGHKWYWCKDQMPDEVTVLKFDSESEKPGSDVAGGIPHYSFHLDGSEDKPPIESLEVRVVAFW
ncbi:hypothetical protein DL98DRAFT_657107 [Cadophora sp. DSE1049]|nr:hypothetical protein DL98DRAFT_657107 [Cadophora sp. DSE1049]